MPTAEQLAFWAAIRANPWDDTPRLVYADWVQENGDEPRAEFIRVQCAQAALGPVRLKTRKQRAALREREDELVTQYKASWSEWLVTPLAVNDSRQARLTWLNQFKYTRGFIDSLQLDIPTTLRLVDSNVSLEPIRVLAISQRHDECTPANIFRMASWDQGASVAVLGILGATDADLFAFLRGES